MQRKNALCSKPLTALQKSRSDKVMLSQLDFRSNSIGFLRLFFAAVVVWSHAFGLGGFGADWISAAASSLSAGYLAVAGFFVLSGFLITRSFETVDNGARFLWHRLLRIFPGFLVCLVVTAFVIAPLGFLHQHETLNGYLAASPSPSGFVTHNAFLAVKQLTIGTMLNALPQPRDLNGSLWTLQWEFLCYLSVMGIGIVGLLKRWRVVTLCALVAIFIADAVALSISPLDRTPFVIVVVQLGSFFWMGGCAYLFRDRIPMNGWAALVCAIAVAIALPIRGYAFMAPCFSYVVLYAARCLPIRSFDRRVDLSYGLYIYAYPIQQILAVYRVNSLGYMVYLLAGAFGATLFAAASWYVVERPSLSLKNATLIRPAATPEML
jgi:peptidoglycan/LPS O-acetylase OafA/YrhL